MDKHLNEMTVDELEAKLKAVEAARLDAKANGNMVLWNQLYQLTSKLEAECARRAKVAGYLDVAQKMFGIII